MPSLHPGQVAVLQNLKRFNYVIAGRRWRKTTTWVQRLIEVALQGEPSMWVSPTFDGTRIAWQEMMQSLGQLAMANQTNHEMQPLGRGIIRFRSSDQPNNMRGWAAKHIVMDEFTFQDPDVWNGILQPMLRESHGQAYFSGTPNGLGYWFTEFMQAKERENSQTWQIPTLGMMIEHGTLIRVPHPYENPTIAFEEMQEAYTSMSERWFRQEFMAEFLSDDLTVFPGVEAISTLETASPYDRNREGHVYALGCDWGRSRDSSIFSVMDMTAYPAEQVEMVSIRGASVQAQLAKLEAVHTRWHPRYFVAEANTLGAPIIDLVRATPWGRNIRPYTMTNASKDEVIQALALGIERQLLRLLNNPTQKRELQSYQSVQLVGGSYRYSAPNGQHDDTVIALALAYWPIYQAMKYRLPDRAPMETPALTDPAYFKALTTGLLTGTLNPGEKPRGRWR